LHLLQERPASRHPGGYDGQLAGREKTAGEIAMNTGAESPKNSPADRLFLVRLSIAILNLAGIENRVNINCRRHG